MIDEHWFDTLNKRLTSAAPRRGILSAMAILSTLPHFASPDSEAKGGGKGGKHKGGGKGKKGGGGKKGHGKGHGNKKPPKPDKGGICGRTWPGANQQADRDHCRRIFAECPPDGDRDFCIVEDYPGHEGDLVADCCNKGEACCGTTCCPANRHCCGGKSCCAANQTCCGEHCGPDPSDPNHSCCDGKLINITRDPENCGGCGVKCSEGKVCNNRSCDCPDGLTNCLGLCVDTKTDPDHCGGCFTFNPNGLTCCEGNLCHYIDGVCCGGTCYPNGWPSCE